MNARLLIAPVAIATALAVAGCGGDDTTEKASAGPAASAAGGNDSVEVKTFMFNPDPIEVEAGTTVTWTNQDSAEHTVTFGTRERPDRKFDERLAESGGTVKRTFDDPGTYRYFCSLHSGPGMEGTVTVR